MQFLLFLFSPTCFFLLSVHSSKLVEYKFGSNFGQIFYDYSESGNHGQNGASTSTTVSDTLPTDRGAYFQTSTQSYIMLPPNDFVSTGISIGSTFSLIMWIKSLDNTDYYLSMRYLNANNFVSIIRVDVGNTLRTQIKRTGYDSGVLTGITAGNLKEGKF